MKNPKKGNTTNKRKNKGGTKSEQRTRILQTKRTRNPKGTRRSKKTTSKEGQTQEKKREQKKRQRTPNKSNKKRKQNNTRGKQRKQKKKERRKKSGRTEQTADRGRTGEHPLLKKPHKPQTTSPPGKAPRGQKNAQESNNTHGSKNPQAPKGQGEAQEEAQEEAQARKKTQEQNKKPTNSPKGGRGKPSKRKDKNHREANQVREQQKYNPPLQA